MVLIVLIPAYSAKQGLERLKEVCPDLVILDVMMEDVAAGFRFLTKVRSDAPDSEFAEVRNVPILMLTAIEQKMKVKFKEKAGTALLPVDQFMSKPVPPKELYQTVCEMLKVAAAGQA